MLFAVTYRGSDGAVRTETVESSCRSDCFAKMSARGISPISIREEKSGHLHTSTPSRKFKSIIISVGIGILLVAVWIWHGFRADVHRTKHIEEGKGQRASKHIAASKNRNNQVSTFSNSNSRLKVDNLNPKEADNKDGYDIGKEVSKKIKVIPSLRIRNPNRRRLFTNHVMCELQHYILPGRDMPPPDKISDKEALEAANMKIEYFDTDTDEELERKKAVEEMLIEMKQYIIAGGSANDFMHRLAARQELEAQAVDETRRTVRALIREGKMEDAKSALSAYNEYLKSKGIPEVFVKGLK